MEMENNISKLCSLCNSAEIENVEHFLAVVKLVENLEYAFPQNALYEDEITNANIILPLLLLSTNGLRTGISSSKTVSQFVKQHSGIFGSYSSVC